MKRDLFRMVILLSLGLVTLSPDGASLWVVLYAVGVTVLLAAVTHLTRRVLMPRLDLQAFALAALPNPVGAAIVFAAIVYLLGVLLQVGVTLLR